MVINRGHRRVLEVPAMRYCQEKKNESLHRPTTRGGDPWRMLVDPGHLAGEELILLDRSGTAGVKHSKQRSAFAGPRGRRILVL